jgi:hypothetical protein
MHDIDRVQLENDTEFEQWESDPAEYETESDLLEAESFEFDEAEAPLYAEAESLFSEADEMDLASELLGVGSEQELDHALGKLIRRGGEALGQPVNVPTGQAIGQLLKGAVARALPSIGSVLGKRVAGASGAQFGGSAVSAAGRLFGLELEGLSGEDQEFELNRGYVRFAGEAIKNLAYAPPGQNLQRAARAATIAAAQKYAPGLLRAHAPAPSASNPTPAGRTQSGRWMRRGNKIVLYGL